MNSHQQHGGLYERIQKRAYEIFAQRRAEDGDETSDWLKAEDEVHEENARQQRGPARCPDRSKWGNLTQPSGHDVENST
jgi:Protein of unknown function (DUF2934)